MSTTKLLAKHFNHIYFGGNWTGATSFKDTINNLTLKQVSQKIEGQNTILALSYHIHYYVKGTMDVLKGKPLTIRDQFSFNHPQLTTEVQWEAFKANLWKEAHEFIGLVEQLNDAILSTTFVEEKYGSYYRNLAGITEHAHYYLGQIAILKKMTLIPNDL